MISISKHRNNHQPGPGTQMVAIGKTCQQEDLSSVQLSFFSTGKGGRPLFKRQDAIFYVNFKYHLEGFLNLAKEEALLVRTPNQSRPELTLMIVPRWRRASHRDSFTPGPCLCSGGDSGDLNKIKSHLNSSSIPGPRSHWATSGSCPNS